MFYYQNALQTSTPNAEFTRRLYRVHAVRSQRAHGALEDPTVLPHRAVLHAVETPSRGVCFEYAKKTPPHGVLGDCTAFPQRCWRLHNAHLGVLHFV